MSDLLIEKKFSSIIATGVFLVTILVTDRWSLEPVNVGKMVLLAVVSGIALGFTFPNICKFSKERYLLTISISGFLFFSLISIFFSSNSWVKGFYGTQGRNTGFLTYFSFSVLFMAIAGITQIANLRKFLNALYLAGLVNLVYCSIAYIGFDFITWQNQYNKILGTFGNPDFISAFLGIFFTYCVVSALDPQKVLRSRLLLVFLCVWTLILIDKTDAIQGFVVAGIGTAIGGLFYVRSKTKNRTLPISYIGFLLIFSVSAIAGMLQKGPLAALLYKPSVSLRGEYWQAGLNMGKDKILTGVGIDSYGTFYRQYRDLSALQVPGVNTVTDAAHNVFIDIFSGTGLFGLIFYVGIILIIGYQSFSVIKSSKTFEPIFVTLLSCWIAFQAQSFISINQIGLAIWGWVFGGSLIAYSRIKSINKLEENLSGKNGPKMLAKGAKNQLIPAAIVVRTFGFGLVFLVTSLPPFLADTDLRHALASQSMEKVIANANRFPFDSSRTNFIIVRVTKSEVNEEIMKLSYKSIEKYPNDYPSLYTFYQLLDPASKEKKEILSRLHKADPFNPQWISK